MKLGAGREKVVDKHTHTTTSFIILLNNICSGVCVSLTEIISRPRYRLDV